MNSLHTLTLSQTPIHAEKLTWFRFGNLGDKVVLTTDTGEWHALEPDVFSTLVDGTLPEDGQDYTDLVQKGFIRNGFDLEFHASQLGRTTRTKFAGATHHRIHLSSQNGALSMEHAKGIVDHIFTGQVDYFSIALIQGPNPIDPNMITFLNEFAEEKNKYEGRGLYFDLHSGLADVDDALVALLVEKRIQVRALFDGDATVHNNQRHLRNAPEHAVAIERIQALHAAAAEAELPRDEYAVFGEVQVGASAIGQAKGIVNGLKDSGIRQFRVTPILEGDQAITPSAYGEFIKDLVGCLENQDDAEEAVYEVQIGALLTRIRTGNVQDGLLMSTAPSTGFSTRSYSIDGHIFPSCSALELHDDGDPIFLLGHVSTESSDDIANHSTVRSLVVASIADCLPGYQHLWSAPFIGVDPVGAYLATGDLFTKMPSSVSHKATQALVESVFLHVLENDDDDSAGEE